MSYCATLKDYQVENVLEIEANRVNNNPDADASLYYEAREECVKRDIDPDTVLTERNVEIP